MIFSGGTEITKVFFSREKSEQQETWVKMSSIYCLWEWNEIKMSFVILLSYGFVRDCVRLMGKGEKFISLTHNQVTNREPRHMCVWETLLERARQREKEIPNSALSTFHIWLTVQSPSAINLSFKVPFWPSQRLSSHSPLSLYVCLCSVRSHCGFGPIWCRITTGVEMRMRKRKMRVQGQ